MLAQIIIENGQKKIKPLTADAGAGNPVGTIVSMYKKSSPSGYLYCDGSTFDQTAYPLLYAYLGSNVLPDYREFALVGAEENTTDVYNASTNPNGTIHDHDVYTEGQAKDDQLQDHKHSAKMAGGTAGAIGRCISSNTPYNQDSTNEVVLNLINARAGTVTRGKRKAVYFYIKATSGLSENAQDNVINTLNEQRSYSTEEHLTGRKWIDGKPTYEKTIDCGALPNNGSKGVDFNITNLDKVVKYRGTTKNNNYTFEIPYVSGGGLANCIEMHINYSTQKITITTGTDRSSFTETYAILEYTKTTD